MDQGNSPQKNSKEEANSSENELPQNPTGNFSSILDNAEKKEPRENEEEKSCFITKWFFEIFFDLANESNKKEAAESEENESGNKIERSRSRSESNSSSRGRSIEQHKYKYYVKNRRNAIFLNSLKKCCDKCKKNDKNGKTCVCVVPANQRKMHISKSLIKSQNIGNSLLL